MPYAHTHLCTALQVIRLSAPQITVQQIRLSFSCSFLCNELGGTGALTCGVAKGSWRARRADSVRRLRRPCPPTHTGSHQPHTLPRTLCAARLNESLCVPHAWSLQQSSCMVSVPSLHLIAPHACLHTVFV